MTPPEYEFPPGLRIWFRLERGGKIMGGVIVGWKDIQEKTADGMKTLHCAAILGDDGQNYIRPKDMITSDRQKAETAQKGGLGGGNPLPMRIVDGAALGMVLAVFALSLPEVGMVLGVVTGFFVGWKGFFPVTKLMLQIMEKQKAKARQAPPQQGEKTGGQTQRGGLGKRDVFEMFWGRRD